MARKIRKYRPAYPVRRCPLCKLHLVHSKVGKSRYRCNSKFCSNYSRTFKNSKFSSEDRTTSGPEWLPIHPCPCGAIRYPDGHRCNEEDGECSPLAYYEGAVDYLKKLLEYQLVWKKNPNLTISDLFTRIESMLEKFEEQNE